MRPAVKEFAEAMESVLKTRDDERGEAGWLNKHTTVKQLLDCLKEEIVELEMAFEECNPMGLVHECLDVANFAMMIKDRILHSSQFGGIKK